MVRLTGLSILGTAGPWVLKGQAALREVGGGFPSVTPDVTLICFLCHGSGSSFDSHYTWKPRIIAFPGYESVFWDEVRAFDCLQTFVIFLNYMKNKIRDEFAIC